LAIQFSLLKGVCLSSVFACSCLITNTNMFYLILNYCFRTKIGRNSSSFVEAKVKRYPISISRVTQGSTKKRSKMGQIFEILFYHDICKIFLYLWVVSLNLSMVSLTSVCKTATKIILCLQVIMIMSQHFFKAEVLTSISHPQNGLNFLTVTPF